MVLEIHVSPLTLYFARRPALNHAATGFTKLVIEAVYGVLIQQ